jgi:hypothetical protein
MKYKLKKGVSLPIHPNYSNLPQVKWSALNGGLEVELTDDEAKRLKDNVTKVGGTNGSLR